MANGRGGVGKGSKDMVEFVDKTPEGTTSISMGLPGLDNGWHPLWDQEVIRLIRKEQKGHPIPMEPKKEEVVKEDSPFTKPSSERFQVPVVVLVELIAQAIAHLEGFYLQRDDPSVAQRFNNPGNLRSWGNVPIGHAKGTGEGYANFPTSQEGWRALRLQVWKNVVGRMTLVMFFYQYAPVGDINRPVQYAEFVKQYMEDRGVCLPSIRVVIADYEIFGDLEADYPGLSGA